MTPPPQLYVPPPEAVSVTDGVKQVIVEEDDETAAVGGVTF